MLKLYDQREEGTTEELAKTQKTSKKKVTSTGNINSTSSPTPSDLTSVGFTSYDILHALTLFYVPPLKVICPHLLPTTLAAHLLFPYFGVVPHFGPVGMPAAQVALQGFVESIDQSVAVRTGLLAMLLHVFPIVV